jgi:hypothetical protein
MKKVAAKKAKKPTETAYVTKDTGTTRKHPGEGSGLAYRYQQIGISAVAAAVRYQGAVKNPAYAPVPINWRYGADEAVA